MKVLPFIHFYFCCQTEKITQLHNCDDDRTIENKYRPFYVQ